MKTFKVLSALLCYPSEELLAAASDLAAILDAENLVPKRERRALDVLIGELASGELYDLQECYGLLFDRTRSLALHLFEHVHGESRDRGQAMVDLRALYEKAGLVVVANELPDYLPMFLEFLATQPFAEAQELLAQPAHILSAIAERLRKRSSSYRAVFEALVAIAAAAPQPALVEALLEVPDPEPTDLAALDAAWEEEEVRFGPGSQEGPCSKESLIAKLRHARRAVQQPVAAQGGAQ
ncbi:MAG: nitrate reductase molybdenum cofactor assembly chaperone [Pseudomonadota bacterium]|jgi:nitrate reductase delta subunit